MLENPLGLLNGDPENQVRAEDVPSGAACNCFCPTPGCVHALRPYIVDRHGSRTSATTRLLTAESLMKVPVHRLAKTILHREKRLEAHRISDVQVSQVLLRSER